MVNAPSSQAGTEPRNADDHPRPHGGAGGVEAAPAAGGRWRPGVRMVLLVIVLIPLLATGVMVASSATKAWSSRHGAQVVAEDAHRLVVVAQARAEMNRLESPLTAVSYARELGISEPVLDQLLKPPVPFRDQLDQQLAVLHDYPTFWSTAPLRADVAALPGVVVGSADGVTTFNEVEAFTTGMSDQIDDVWFRDYDQLQRDVSAWQPPGTFEVRVSTLRQTYQAFLAGGAEIANTVFVLEGLGPPNAKQELIQAAGEFQTATGEFVGQLGPGGEQAWRHLQTDAVDRHFAGTVDQAVTVAIDNQKPPFAGNLAFAGASSAPGLDYLSDLDHLVTAASDDLHATALAQAATATRNLVLELVLLFLLTVVCVGGVVLAGRVLTRPLKRLAGQAAAVGSGDFDLPPLPDSGPREVATTTTAFNDMASTLKAVEAKAVALAAEDLTDPELFTPLPGRTGRALQASIDALASRIREREMQRQLLHEAATHDSLTGLLNRPAVFEYLTHDVSRRREAGETVAVLFIDLDGLKPLNDVYGHEAGDNAILATGLALQSATDSCDVVGRLGGDEFLVVLCHDHSCDGDTVVARIRQCVADCRIPVNDTMVPLEASVGVALAQCDPHTDPMLLVRQADEAMYEAKKAARATRERIASGH